MTTENHQTCHQKQCE